jgi:hypothetical protein
LDFDQNVQLMPGMHDASMRSALIEQLLASVHRVEYVRRLRQMELGACRTDPHDERFDPLKAAVLHARNGDPEEAFWLVFLSVHFGKHGRGGWRYLRDVYGRLGSAQRWDWQSVNSDVHGFRSWLDLNQGRIQHGHPSCGFGNHRKYESLSGTSPNGTGAVVESYVEWIADYGSHQALIRDALARAEGDAQRAFDLLYRDMARRIHRFGRLARFDFLAMLGKLELASIEPGSTYLDGATGPLSGARLLFGIKGPSSCLDQWLVQLGARLGVGMQVLEDALCNWQKSPRLYVPFRG